MTANVTLGCVLFFFGFILGGFVFWTRGKKLEKQMNKKLNSIMAYIEGKKW